MWDADLLQDLAELPNQFFLAHVRIAAWTTVAGAVVDRIDLSIIKQFMLQIRSSEERCELSSHALTWIPQELFPERWCDAAVPRH